MEEIVNIKKEITDIDKINNDNVIRRNILREKLIKLSREKYPIVYVIRVDADPKRGCDHKGYTKRFWCFSTKEIGEKAIHNHKSAITDCYHYKYTIRIEESVYISDEDMLRMDTIPKLSDFPDFDY